MHIQTEELNGEYEWTMGVTCKKCNKYRKMRYYDDYIMSLRKDNPGEFIPA